MILRKLLSSRVLFFGNSPIRTIPLNHMSLYFTGTKKPFPQNSIKARESDSTYFLSSVQNTLNLNQQEPSSRLETIPLDSDWSEAVSTHLKIARSFEEEKKYWEALKSYETAKQMLVRHEDKGSDEILSVEKRLDDMANLMMKNASKQQSLELSEMIRIFDFAEKRNQTDCLEGLFLISEINQKIFKNAQHYQLASRYFKKEFQIRQRIGAKSYKTVVRACRFKIYLFRYQKDIEKKNESALKFANQINQMMQKLKQMPEYQTEKQQKNFITHVLVIWIYLGAIWLSTNSTQQALSSFSESINFMLKNLEFHQTKQIVIAYYSVISCYAKLDDPISVKKYQKEKENFILTKGTSQLKKACVVKYLQQAQKFLNQKKYQQADDSIQKCQMFLNGLEELQFKIVFHKQLNKLFNLKGQIPKRLQNERKIEKLVILWKGQSSLQHFLHLMEQGFFHSSVHQHEIALDVTRKALKMTELYQIANYTVLKTSFSNSIMITPQITNLTRLLEICKSWHYLEKKINRPDPIQALQPLNFLSKFDVESQEKWIFEINSIVDKNLDVKLEQWSNQISERQIKRKMVLYQSYGVSKKFEKCLEFIKNHLGIEKYRPLTVALIKAFSLQWMLKVEDSEETKKEQKELKYLLELHEFMKKNIPPPSEEWIYLLYSITRNYRVINDRESAIKYGLQTFEMIETMGFDKQESQESHIICYDTLFDLAIDHKSINDKVSALIFLQKIIDLIENRKDIHRLSFIKVWERIGQIYYQEREIDKSFEYFIKSYNLTQEYNVQPSIHTLLFITDIYFSKTQEDPTYFDKFSQCFDKCQELISGIQQTNQSNALAHYHISILFTRIIVEDSYIDKAIHHGKIAHKMVVEIQGEFGSWAQEIERYLENLKKVKQQFPKFKEQNRKVLEQIEIVQSDQDFNINK